MENGKPVVIRLSQEDNVITAVQDLAAGKQVEEGVSCREDIPNGHKVAAREIRSGQPVRKYGQIIGFASETIHPGDHVHTHNVAMGTFDRDYAIGAETGPTDYVPEGDLATFDGFVREDGRVGTRNYIGVLATVSCSTSVVHFIADRFSQDVLRAYPNVDGVVGLGHTTGCGMATNGEGFHLLQKTMAG